MRARIHEFYQFNLDPASKRLKKVESEADRDEIKRKFTEKRIIALLDKGAYLEEPAGLDEVRLTISSISYRRVLRRSLA